MSVRIYVEGGGDQRASCARLRQGLAEFLKKVISGRPLPRLIACGSRNDTFDRFQTAHHQRNEDFVLILVDSEHPVAAGTKPWAHLAVYDRWQQPSGATDDQAHLMVQCMECWFLADKEALVEYYGQGFAAGSLPRRRDVEQIGKDVALGSLRKATQNTRTKGAYDKVEHGSDLLARVDPARVRRASRHADAFCVVVARESS